MSKTERDIKDEFYHLEMPEKPNMSLIRLFGNMALAGALAYFGTYNYFLTALAVLFASIIQVAANQVRGDVFRLSMRIYSIKSQELISEYGGDQEELAGYLNAQKAIKETVDQTVKRQKWF